MAPARSCCSVACTARAWTQPNFATSSRSSFRDTVVGSASSQASRQSNPWAKPSTAIHSDLLSILVNNHELWFSPQAPSRKSTPTASTARRRLCPSGTKTRWFPLSCRCRSRCRSRLAPRAQIPKPRKRGCPPLLKRSINCVLGRVSTCRKLTWVWHTLPYIDPAIPQVLETEPPPSAWSQEARASELLLLSWLDLASKGSGPISIYEPVMLQTLLTAIELVPGRFEQHEKTGLSALASQLRNLWKAQS